MLFNSRPFLLAFLPLTLLLVLGLRHLGHRTSAKVALIGASLFFYGWWSPKYLVLLVGLLAFNYGVARFLLRAGTAEQPSRMRAPVFVFGLAANVLALGYFKYATYLVAVLDHHTPIHLKIAAVVLPLGLSFITFQKIAFLADIHSGAVTGFALVDYALFVTFFPQLIAGPIVHHAEVIPQFERPDALRGGRLKIASGLSLFVIGLVKKAVFADAVGPTATAAFALAARGGPVDFFSAWSGALAYMLQLYFDFSAYSDMAIGLGLMFGINLPFNFNSPYKATSIIDFWQRWHITLTRFLTAYIYNPIVVGLTRRRAARGLSVVTRKGMTPGAFLTLQALPTLVTMLICGVWHGAGLQFIAFGLLHGVYLVLNHGYRAIRGARGITTPPRGVRVWGRALTLLAVLVAQVLFRADSLGAARVIFRGMVGRAGFVIPAQVDWSLVAFALGLFLVTQLAPNSQELLGSVLVRLRATGARRVVIAKKPEPARRWYQPVWKPNLAWGLVLAAAGFYAMLQSSGSSEFLYFNF